MDILTGIYPFFFLLSLLGLVGWFYFRGSSYTGLMSKMFLFSFFIYLLALAFSPASLGFKLIILSRDFILMAVIVTGFQFLSRVKVLYFGALGVLLAIFLSVAFDYWKDTFNLIKPNIALDQPQLIVHLKKDFNENSIALIKRRFDLDCRPLQLSEDAAAFFTTTISCRIPNQFLSQKDQLNWLLNRHPGISDWEWNQQISLITPPSKGPMEQMGSQPNNSTTDDPLNNKMWHYEKLNYSGIHEILSRYSSEIKQRTIIAILDTGIDHQHEDLAENFVSSGEEHHGDPMGHGTHCAGIAAAVSNNGLGISSLSPTNEHYQITSIRVLDKNGFGSKKNIAKGIIEAADKGAQVISLSLGGPSIAPEKLYEKAVQYANRKNAIVVVAAGNAARPAGEFSPANVKGVIAVGASNANKELSSFSNTPEGVDLFVAAPGQDIFSTLPGNRYEYFSGTSMATPLVASLVAILKSYQPELNTREIYDILNRTGEPLNKREEIQLIAPFNSLELILGSKE